MQVWLLTREVAASKDALWASILSFKEAKSLCRIRHKATSHHLYVFSTSLCYRSYSVSVVSSSFQFRTSRLQSRLHLCVFLWYTRDRRLSDDCCSRSASLVVSASRILYLLNRNHLPSQNQASVAWNPSQLLHRVYWYWVAVFQPTQGF